MKLKRLELKAFGHFTDRILEFESKEPGLHIIFGPNEAGKSSSLRALEALLYGFKERTPDNFRHANNQLLVGGTIEGNEGQELTFFRRKKRKADLLDTDGTTLDPGALATFMHGVDLNLFKSLYGIDHKTLVAGGEDILAQQGEVGQALFAAGTGISSLKKILDSLDTEANELFKSKGRKQQISQAIKEYKDLKRIVKEASLRPSAWKKHQKKLQETEEEHARLETESKAKGAEIQHLDRLSKVIPELAELENLQTQLTELGDIIVLPLEFPQNLREVEQQIRETRLQHDLNKARLAKLHEKQNNVTLNQALLDHGETIEDLHQRLQAYRDGLQDRIKLDGMRIAHRLEAGTLIESIRSDLTLNDAESLRPVLGKKRTIQDLSSRYEALNQQALQSKQQKKSAKKKLEEITKTMGSQPVIKENDALAKAIKLAQKVGNIDTQIEEISRDITALTKSSQAELKRLGLWSGNLEQLLELPLPLQETLRRYEGDFDQIDKEKQQLAKERDKAETELQVVLTDSKEIAYVGSVPSEKDLDDSRQRRQEGWHIIKRQWLNDEDITKDAEVYAPGLVVHDAYEKNVEQADLIADRLRREAERVAKAASLRARQESLDELVLEIIQKEKNLSVQENTLTTKWKTEWESTKINPLTPKEMLAWLTEIDKLRFRVTEIRNKESEAADRDKARQKYRKALTKELTSLGERETSTEIDLAPILTLAESILSITTQQKTERDNLADKKTLAQTALEQARKAQQEAEDAKIDWQKQWDKSLTGLGLKEQVLPSEALDLLDTISNCLSKLKAAKEFQSRINGIDRDVDKFNTDVKDLVTLASPGLNKLSPDQAVLKLHTLFGKALRENEQLQKANEEIEDLTEEIDTSQKILDNLAEQMTTFLTIASCAQVSELSEAINKSVQYQGLSEKLSNAKSSLAKMSDGISVEEIKLQVADIVVDELPGQILSLRRQVENELAPKIQDSLKLIGEESKELEFMDGSGLAAEEAEKMEQVAAKINRLVGQYTKVKFATKVLQDEIEHYREENQDPILQIASGIFSKLTIDSFAGLRTDMDDHEKPILVGMRENGSRVPVNGMSDGTCDQLYLALRLATLEIRLETTEPIPFIVDDILINFDDERSKATLTALASLSKKNQVILFTHHSQILETAKAIKVGEICVHEL